MELAFVIYFIELTSKLAVADFSWMIASVIFGSMIFALCVIFVGGIMLELSDDEWKPYLNKIKKPYLSVVKTLAVFWIIGSTLSFLSPTKETSYTMLAAYGVQTVAESEDVQRVAGKSLKVLEGYMDEYMKEVEKTKETVEEKTEEVK